MEWISVNDRLPEEEAHGFSIWTLTYSTSGMIQKDRIDEKEWLSYKRGYVVTHWMPLPEPPKE